MASEGGRREKALKINGCNYYGKTTTRSAPFATFWRDDLLRLTLEMNEWYLAHIDEFPGEPVESIIPEKNSRAEVSRGISRSAALIWKSMPDAK